MRLAIVLAPENEWEHKIITKLLLTSLQKRIFSNVSIILFEIVARSLKETEKLY